MTEKRYLNIIPSGIQDTETGKIIQGSKIGDLLNKQDERIKELEQENKRLKQGKYIYGVHGGSNDRK